MEYTFQDGFAEMMPRFLPEYFFRTVGGVLEFAVPGHNVTTLDYMVKVAAGHAPLSDNMNLRRITSGAGGTASKVFDINKYLLQRGDERVKDMVSLDANAKYFSAADTAGSHNQASLTQISGEFNRPKVTLMMQHVIKKVMYENSLDVLVNPENTVPHQKVGGPSEPSINGRGAAGATQTMTALLGFPEIIVPAGYNEIVYEPQFVLNATNDNYNEVTGTVQSFLPAPLPIGMMFWAGQGDEPTLIKVAAAYEAATHHRIPPPDFGPL